MNILFFSVDVLVLGVALTLMASKLCGLVLARRRVRCAPEPLLQACLMVLVVVFISFDQWNDPGPDPDIANRYVRSILSLLTMKAMVLYFAVTTCLPEVREPEGEIDLFVYYDETRELSYGALSGVLALCGFYYLTLARPAANLGSELTGCLGYLAPCFALMFLRWRWLNILLLVAGLIFFGSSIMESRGTVSSILSTIFHES